MIRILTKLLVVIVLLGVSLTGGASVSDYHPLTLAELREEEQAGRDSVALQLALARKIGQFDQAQSIEILTPLLMQGLSPEHQLIASAYACGMNVTRGMMEAAEPHCDDTINLLSESEPRGVAHAIARNAIGYNFIRSGRSDLALEQFELALRTKDLDDPVITVTTLHNRGVAMMLSGMTDLAIDAFETASQDSAGLASDEPLPSILAYNLGYVQAQAGNHEEALRSYAIVTPWLESTGQTTRQYIASAEISLSLIGVGRYKDALNLLDQWNGRTDVNASADSQAQHHMAKGQALIGLERFDEAEQQLLEGIRIAEAGANATRLKELSVAFGRMLIETRQIERAVDYLADFITTIENEAVSLELGPSLELLAEAYALAGNYEQAFLSIKKADEAARKSMTDDFARRLASLTVSNELAVKDQQLYLAREKEKAAEADRRLSRLLQVAILGAALVLLILVTLLLRHRSRVRETELHRQSAERLSEEVRIRTEEVEQALQGKIAAEKERADLEVRVANDEKLRLIGQLTGGVAHDFNNLLTVIQLSSELLQTDLPESSRKLAEDIIAASESGKAITEGLLAYARQQVLQPTRIHLPSFLKANQSIFKRAGKESVLLVVDLPDLEQSTYIQADAGQLVSAVMNLVLNAREASTSDKQVRLFCEVRGAKVAITVEDSGRGMSDIEVRNAIEPFYSTKAPSEGSGLGLAMVEGFMNQSGGSVEIESKPHEGTSVRLVFDQCDPEAQTSDDSVVQLRASKGETIMLVEDDEQVRAVGKMSLEGAGYCVVVATNGDEALQLFQSNSVKIDLLISDLVMPGSIAGDQLVDEVLKIHPGLPVLLITGYSANATIQYPVLLKPFKLDALLAKVKEQLP